MRGPKFQSDLPRLPRSLLKLFYSNENITNIETVFHLFIFKNNLIN